MTNPLVAASVDTATPFSGAFLIEDGQNLVDAIETGNWVEGGFAAFSSVLDAAAFVVDPIGTLIANGLGWVLDHIEPLKGWLNQFTGNAGEVMAFAQTWRNVGTRLHDCGDAYGRATYDLEGMSGQTIDAYLAFANDAIAQLHATGDWANAIGQGMEMASQMVQIVHDLVRDAVSQIVGTAISVALEEALSFGLATPVAIGQITTKVSSLASRVGRTVKRLLAAFKKLDGLLDSLRELFVRAGGMIKKLLHGSPKPVDTRPYLTPGSRPSFRKGVIEKVWNNAKDPDGLVRDPNTHEVINWTPGTSRKGVWDMGHVPEAKYHEKWLEYVDGKMTPEEFRDWYNDPTNYQPELPGNNRSHRYE